MSTVKKITTLDGVEYDIEDSTARSGLNGKQDALVSGENIKTINSENILGSGNLVIDTTIEDGSVTTSKLDDEAVTTAKIDDGAVTTNKLDSASVTTAKLADNSVTSAKIANGTIVAEDLAADSVTTVKIADEAITMDKLGQDVIDAIDEGGGGGTTNYNLLSNKPQINNITLSGNKSDADLGLASASDLSDLANDVAELQTALSGAMHYIGVTTTALSDGSSVNPIVINGESVTAVSGDVAIHSDTEFVFSSTDNKWHEFGSTGSLKALAFKDSASGTYTPVGTINVTPSVTMDTTTVNSITNVGSLPALTTTVVDENLIISFDAGALPTKGTSTTVATGVASATATGSFSGTQGTITVS